MLMEYSWGTIGALEARERRFHLRNQFRLANYSPLSSFRREAQIGRATAYKLIASGEIPHIRIGPKITRIPFWVLETLAGRRNPCT